MALAVNLRMISFEWWLFFFKFLTPCIIQLLIVHRSRICSLLLDNDYTSGEAFQKHPSQRKIPSKVKESGLSKQ